MLDTDGEWFDHWIDTLAHDLTTLYYSVLECGERTNKHVVGIQDSIRLRVHSLGIYDKEIR